ncbi:MAG: putative viral replication protein [Capamivirus cipi]|uniref:Replication-associated protein n=1 Tax=Circoviridae sp. TaxID=1954248 RepID=A0A345MNX5_9VIRU|nr:MAG: putative viral replication protein [Circoviridae sp.]
MSSNKYLIFFHKNFKMENQGNVGTAMIKNFCFTWYDVNKFDAFFDKDLDRLGIQYIVMGREFGGRNGKEHLQGYCELKKAKRFTTIKNMIFEDKKVHIEERMGSQEQAIDYCKKDGDWREWGTPFVSKQGQRTDWMAIRDRIMQGASEFDIMMEFPMQHGTCSSGIRRMIMLRDKERAKHADPYMPEVIVYCGPAGSGKTYRCASDPDYKSDGYCMLQQASGKAYFDGYEGESVVWFDEFGGSLFPFSIFLAIVSEWGTRVETKGSSVVFHPKKILISTTRWPCEWWPESRHFNKDPFQLYRRISKLYKLERPRRLDDGSMEYPEPQLITDKEKVNWNNDYCEEYYNVCNKHITQSFQHT